MFICGHLKIKNPYFSQDRDDVVGYPFILGIPKQWQFEAMLRWANHGAISMDVTFGTNHMKFHLFTLVVFNDFRNGVQIAWMITSRQNKKKFNSMVDGIAGESDEGSTRMASKLFYRR